MNPFRYFIQLVSVALAFSTSAHAVEFRLLNWDGYDADLKFMHKGKSVPVVANENELSPVYKYNDAEPLVFFKEVRRDDKIVKEPVAMVQVPAGMTHGILILAATDDASKAYAGFWVEDSPESRPAGTIRFVNLSRYPTMFKLGGTQFSISPSGAHQVNFDPTVQRVVVQGAAHVDNQWVVISGNPVPVRPGLRLLVVMRDGRPSIGRDPSPVDLVSFYDRPPPVLPVASSGGGL